MHCHCFVPKTTDTDEHFVAYKVHQTKTETLYYTGIVFFIQKNNSHTYLLACKALSGLGRYEKYRFSQYLSIKKFKKLHI